MSKDPAVQQSQTAVAGQGAQAQGRMAFSDVAIYFLREEWTLLDDSQRHLYHQVMMEVFVLMSSLACYPPLSATRPPHQGDVVKYEDFSRVRVKVRPHSPLNCGECPVHWLDLGLVPTGTLDITQMESSGDPFIPALRFLTPRVEVAKTAREQRILTGEVPTALRQQQLSCAEKPLGRSERRVPGTKSNRKDLSEAALQSTDNSMNRQTPSSLLGHPVTRRPGEPPRSTKRGEVARPREKRKCQCGDCGKSFSCKSLLLRHQRIHTGEKPFKCNECGKSFIQKADLNQHVRVHTGEKPFKCRDCGKAFKHNRSLVGHQRLHTGERPYKCSRCGDSYMNKCSLIRHYRVHTGEKPYKCSDCGRSFKEQSSLVYHARAHTGERPFKCGECKKCFKKNSHLVKHRRVHSIGRPFKCKVCGRVFTVRYSLLKHRRFHTAAKHHECKECGRVFCYRTGLSRHRKIHTERSPECTEREKSLS